jgi:hypothetical protein
MAANEEWEEAEQMESDDGRTTSSRRTAGEPRDQKEAGRCVSTNAPFHSIASRALSAAWISRIMDSGWPTQAR